MFRLRDELADSQFRGRVQDVFATLGTSQVNKSADADKKKTDSERLGENNTAGSKSAKRVDKKPDKPTSRGRRDEDSRSRDRRVDGKDRSRQSSSGSFEFKKPTCPRARRGYVPDFRKNPNKWTKYSLADVPDNQMSSKSNTKAALQFLQEIRERKEADESGPAADLSQKIVFKRRRARSPPESGDQPTPESGNQPSPESEDRPPPASGSFVGSKSVMPECVVGRPAVKKKAKKDRRQAAAAGQQLKLSHLDDEEDE